MPRNIKTYESGDWYEEGRDWFGWSGYPIQSYSRAMDDILEAFGDTLTDQEYEYLDRLDGDGWVAEAVKEGLLNIDEAVEKYIRDNNYYWEEEENLIDYMKKEAKISC